MNDLQKIDTLISDAAGQFANTIAQYQWHILPDTQLQAAKQALTKSDYMTKIAMADPGAVHDALMNAAVLGLDLTEGKRQGWLLPRKNQRGKTVINLQVGYKGVEAIHQRMGVIDRLVIRTVRENDQFDWSGDDQEKPNHTAEWFQTDEQRGKITGAYAITYYPSGAIHVTVASIHEIYEKHRDRSDSYKTYLKKMAEYEADNNKPKPYPPPWITDEKAMVEKTMAYIASKQWPANIRDQDRGSKILETLHTIDMADYSRYTPEQRDAFHQFIKADDALGLYLFSQRVDIEIFVELFNTFEKGTKTEMKKKVRSMETLGAKQLQAIIDGINAEDFGQVKENIDGSLDVTIKLVITQLDGTQKEIFKELLEANSDATPENA